MLKFRIKTFPYEDIKSEWIAADLSEVCGTCPDDDVIWIATGHGVGWMDGRDSQTCYLSSAIPMPEGMFTSYEEAKSAFQCDGECNNGSDVCACKVQWFCRECGETITVMGEDMGRFEHGGPNLCGKCQFKAWEAEHPKEAAGHERPEDIHIDIEREPAELFGGMSDFGGF